MDFHFGRRLLVLGFAVALVAGLVTAASAIQIEDYPEIRLIYNEEQPGHPGNAWLGRELISIGDTIEVRVTATPPESIDYVIANLCAYGGGTHDTLHHFQGQDAWISGQAWIPSCSDGGSTATMNGPTLWGLRNPSILDETWQVWYDDDSGDWEAIGNLTGTLGLEAVEGSLYYAINGGGDTLFTFTISGVSGVCCNTPLTDCDHFEFETHAPLQADSTFVKRFAVEDGGECWIDHNPCWYEGHWDARAQVIACDTSVAFCDTAMTLWPGRVWSVVGAEGGDSLWVDTHWTTYAQLEDPAGYGAEFIESNDYTFEFDFDNSGLGPIFGLPDEILNPSSPCAGLNPDQVCALIDMRKLAHENGNDDIDSLYFDLSSIGDAWADPLTVPTGDVNDGGFWFIENANYGDIDCDMTGPLTWGGDPYNGWSGEGVFSLCWNVLPGQTDEVADVEYIMMWWISDSGDTTFFPVPTHKLAAIDNIIPGMTDTTLAEPRDTVDVDDVTFDADMTLAGNSNVLNPVSEGNPTPDWLQAMIDLDGLFDLDDVTGGGQGWVSMTGIGVYAYDSDVPPPFGWGGVVPMGPMSPIWGSEEIDVIASPPSPYDWDQDSVLVQVWIFDNAGNVFCVGPATADYRIDNILPIISEAQCLAGPYIYAEIENDVAFKPGIANVGAPLDMECGGLYNNRDEIVLHADLGDALGIAEVGDVEYVTDAYDPFCVGGIRLFDDGTHGSDPVTNDKNFTGHARIEVGGSTRNDTTFCVVDTDGDSLGFSVLVTDDAGNAAINEACRGIRVDNEIQTMSPEHVSMYFYDDPETIELDGDKNGDGIVNTGDLLIFEWRVEDEPWEDGEISNLGLVWVDLASIDPSWSGHVDLDRIPSGGIWRNYYPDEPGPFGDLFEVPSGSVDGAQLQANFTNWDNAGNTPGWCLFTSDLILDDLGPSLDCDSIAITVSGADEIASIGDTLYFSYDGPDEDAVAIGIWVGSITSLVDTLWLVQGEGVWTGSVLVTEGTLDTDNLFVDVWAFDDVGNEWYGKGCAGPIVIDNEPPAMTCTNAWLRLWDYNDNVISPTRVVNVGDNLTAIYWDEDGDVVRATADFSNYYDTEMVYEMVSEFAFGPPEKWGYRVDPVPDGDIDQPAGGIKTKVKITAYDDAGNMTEAWFCPMWYSESLINGGDNWLYNHGGLCSSCLPVDTERPEAVPPDAITFELLETSNGIANVGDRLRIIVNMGDPTAPGYDMEWSTAFVQADIGQYGDDYDCANMDDCDYLFLTDDGYSAGGEGDGRFSYFFWFDEDDGPTLFEGAPILPGETDLPASDDGTKIRVRALDDAGNWSLDWTWSDVLVSADTGYPVPVDNYIPEIDPADINVTFVDNDANGICDIGDEVTITVDMTDAPGGAIAGVYANLYDWGHPSQDMVPLVPGSPIYSITFTAQRNPGDFCVTQPDGGVGFEDLAADHNCGMAPLQNPAPRVEVVAKDVSDNWSAYEWVGAPEDSLPDLLALPPSGPTFKPVVGDWPFTWDWMFSDYLDMLADTDAPDPVNPTFPYPSIPASGIQSVVLQDGRIGLQMFYRKMPRNQDVQEFYVYGDLAEAGTIDWATFLGEPIPAGTVPTNNTLGGGYEWISDVLPERADDAETPLDESVYHFGVLAVDNANNTSDPALTWVTGISADATAPTAYLDAAFQYSEGCNVEGQPTTIGGDNVNLIGYLDEASEYINVVYVELYGRVKDLDPSTEGDQPGLWTFLDEMGGYPSSSTLDAPFVFDSDVIPEAFDITHCETFELVVVPWDQAGNHVMPDDAQIFTFTYDSFDPIVTMFAINGNPSPYDMELANSALIEVTALDECSVTSELTYWLYITQMGGVNFSTDPLLSRQTLPVGEPFTYNWDLVNYPEGYARVELYVCDQAGNYVMHFKRIVVIDQSVPDGVFARENILGSHPYYTRLLDGHNIPGGEFTDTWFWTRWPDPIPYSMYDVTQVKMEWRMAGSLNGWTTIGILTADDDTLTWDGSVWTGYDFTWDTRIFNEGDQVELQATVMDDAGNQHSQSITVTVAAEAPILTLTIPEAQDVCSENRIKGVFNIIGTEVSNPIDTYYVSYIIKKHDYPDLGDCNPLDTNGWIASGDSLMLETGTTQETIWRVTINPATAFMGLNGQTPTYGMADGAYDIALVTIDVAGNWSWDTNDDMCVDAGYFEWAVANGMGMTVVLQNEAPEVRLRTVNDFGPVDQPWPWPQPVYVQADDAVTVTSWTESTCDVAKVEYYLADTDTSNDVVLDGMKLVAVSTSPDYYQATFPPSGGVGQYLVPGALQHGYVVVELVAKLTDVLGNESFFYADMWILDISPASAMITSPAPGSYIRHTVALEADALADDEIYSVTYQYRRVGTTTWIPIATTRPHDGDPWDTDINGNTIYWNTDLVADGAYEMEAVSKDADLVDDPNPPIIRVFVDNTVPAVTVFNQTPKFVTGSAVPPAPTTWIGGPKVELTATATDAGGIRYVRFWYKLVDEHVDDSTLLFEDGQAPYAYTWDTGFTCLKSGWYNLIAEAEDMAGNVTYYGVTVYIDQWAPDGWITQINDDQTPGGSDFNGVLAITGLCKDDVPMAQVENQKYDSGLKGAQFQYRAHVLNGGGGGLLGSEPYANWVDLGGVIMGIGPTYTINWDTGTLVPGMYDLRIVGIDNVNNRADVDGTPELASTMIYIVDLAVPKAIIAGVDKVSGTIWATTDTHGQDDIAFVRFEYKVASALETAEWTVIGEVDYTESYSGLFGTLWHFAALPNGNYWVHAVAYDNDYDVVRFPNLYDQNPAMMMVTIANGEVTMASTAQITSLDRWGNLEDYEGVMVQAVCAAGKPTVIVVKDDDPEDHFNIPRAWKLDLERPDDQTIWVDGFSASYLGDWGIATIIGTYNNAGTVGAKTSTVKVFRVTDVEGTKGVVSQDGMSINIPPGAIYESSNGLMMIKIQTPIAKPTIDPIVPVGQTVFFEFLDDQSYWESWYEFVSGMWATVTLPYDPALIPAGYTEANLRVAVWLEPAREWDYEGISNITVDQVNNKVTFLTKHTGAYAVVAGSTLRITEPVYVPGCGDYTGTWPAMYTTIEDLLYGIRDYEIKVILDGPAGNKVFNNMVLYYHEEPMEGVQATYDEVSHNLYLAFDPAWDWEEYYYQRLGKLYDGLPAGTYTLTIKALNLIGDLKTLTDTFIVDAAKPTLSFAGTYVAANPSFTLDVDDAHSGVNFETVFLDVFAIRTETCLGCETTEAKEYLGTATPSAMSYDEETGQVTFEHMTFGQTLSDGMSIDVIVYDGHLPFDYYSEGWYNGQVLYNGCTDNDDHQCRSYYSEQGIADCVGNHANPVWRRFTVDAVPPVMTVLSDPDDQTIEIRIDDPNCGIDDYQIWVDGYPMYEEEVTYIEISNNHSAILRFEVGAGAHDVMVKAFDCVGNFSVVEINKGADVVGVSDVKSYPNPFDPWKGEYATISFDLNKTANVMVQIYDFAGEPVAMLSDRSYGSGTYTVNWFGTDEAGNIVGTGAYIGYIKIDDGQRVVTKNLKIGVANGSND